MQELRLVLIVVGVLAIAALLIHGLWTSKKEKPAKFGEKPFKKMSNVDSQGFDEDGIGEVRVVADKPSRKEPAFNFGAELDDDPLLATSVRGEDSHHNIDRSVNDGMEPETPAFSDSVSNHQQHQEAPLDFVEQPLSAVTQESGVVNHDAESIEPVVQASMNDIAPVDEPLAQTEPSVALTQDTLVEPVLDTEASTATPVEPEVLVLHVHANHGEVFKGSRLLNVMEQYQLQFGEMNVYHRQSDDGKKVIFSVANIVKPGVFQRDAEFNTPGISLFMTLPCYGSAEQNFKVMLHTAQQIADDMGGLVMDEQRQMITPQKLDTYRERIKMSLTA